MKTKTTITWLLKKMGIWNFVWREFERQYPVRIKFDEPKLKQYNQEMGKVMSDMIIHGMGATKHVDWEGIYVEPKN